MDPAKIQQTKRLVGQLPNMGIPTAYVGACTSDPNPHPELILVALGWQ